MSILLASLSLASIGTPAHVVRHCNSLYTPAMGERAALVIYRGDRRVTLDNLRLLGMIERCQRNPAMQPIVRTFDRHQDALHKARIAAAREASVTSYSWPWSCIADHEGEPPGNPRTDTGNGFYSGLQFTMSTWESYGGTGNPADAPIPEQERVAERVLAAQGWGAWPNSSRECGL